MQEHTEEDEIEEIDLGPIMCKEKQQEPKTKPTKKERAPLIEESYKDVEKKLNKKIKNEKPTEEDVKRKRALILHLGMYLNQFPDELKSFKKVNLEKKTISELEDLIKEFHVVMDSKNDLKAETQAMLSMLQAYEYIMIEYAGVQCNGLTVGIAQDPDAIKNIKLIILKHSPLITVEPEARLLMKVLMTTMQLHTINTFNAQMKQQLNNNETITTINDEYKEI